MLTEEILEFRKFCEQSVADLRPQIDVLVACEQKVVAAIDQLRSVFDSRITEFGGKGTADSQPKTGLEDDWSKGIDSIRQDLNKQFAAIVEQLRSSMNHYRVNADFFTLVVFGKVKAGKSSLANVLTGYRLPGVPQEGFEFKAISEAGKEVSLDCFKEDELECTYQIQWCQIGSLKIVDTPGLDSMTDRHHKLSFDFVANSDLVLYATNHDGPLRGTDYQHIKRLCDSGKRMVAVITRSDDRVPELEGTFDEYRPPRDGEREQQEIYLCNHLTSRKRGTHSGIRQDEICSVSTKLARNGINKPDEGYQIDSNFGRLIAILKGVMNEEGPKLRVYNPCDTLLNYLDQLSRLCDSTVQNLDAAAELISQHEEKLPELRRKLLRDCGAIYETVELEIKKAQNRVESFVDDMFNLKKMIAAAFNKNKAKQKMQARFKEMVLDEEKLQAAVKNAAESVQKKMQATIENFCMDIIEEIKSTQHYEAGSAADQVLDNLMDNTASMVMQLILLTAGGALGEMVAGEIAIQLFFMEIIGVTTAFGSAVPIVGTIIGAVIGTIIGGILFKMESGESKNQVRNDIQLQLEYMQQTLIEGDSIKDVKGLEQACSEMVDKVIEQVHEQMVRAPLEMFDSLKKGIEDFKRSLETLEREIIHIKHRRKAK